MEDLHARKIARAEYEVFLRFSELVAGKNGCDYFSSLFRRALGRSNHRIAPR
jgi:hypothetical protein